MEVTSNTYFCGVSCTLLASRGRLNRCIHIPLTAQGRKDALEEHHKTAVHAHLNLACQKIKENEIRSTCTNGVFIWRIDHYRKQFDQALSATGEDPAIFSPAFYTAQYGYKLRLKAYLNGRDRGRGTHLSLYIIIMRGEYDALLDWPFKQKITFYLLDQGDQSNHRTHQLSPNRSLPNIKVVFNRPTVRENLGIGNPCFVPHKVLEAGEYIKDDTTFIKVVVESSTSTSVWGSAVNTPRIPVDCVHAARGWVGWGRPFSASGTALISAPLNATPRVWAGLDYRDRVVAVKVNE